MMPTFGNKCQFQAHSDVSGLYWFHQTELQIGIMVGEMSTKLEFCLRKTLDVANKLLKQQCHHHFLTPVMWPLTTLFWISLLNNLLHSVFHEDLKKTSLFSTEHWFGSHETANFHCIAPAAVQSQMVEIWLFLKSS